MSDDLRRRLQDHVVVCDGAMGSELLTSVDSVTALDMAAVERPKEVLTAHLRYLEAGAELIETITFAASGPRLARHGAGDEMERVNSAAVKIAREAREISGKSCLVAGSIGPLAGVVDLDETDGPKLIASAHAEQAAVLAGRGADLLILETFFRRDELELAVRAVKRVTDLPLIGLLTFAPERPPHDYQQQAGEIAAIAELELDAVGLNCSPGPMFALELFRALPEVPTALAAMPNSGVLQRRDQRILMPPATPEYLARFARQAAALGVSLIGGCCGTGPEHIKAISDAVRDIKPVAHSGPTRVTVEAPAEPERAARVPESSLAEKLREGRFVRLVQIDPPKGTNADQVLQAADRIAEHGGVDAVDINSNPLARLRMDSLWLAEEIQRRSGLECVPHITPRDASLMGLQAQLLGAWLKGIRNLLAVSGDPSQLGDYPGVHDVYHVNIFELVRSLSRMAEGFDCAGNPVGDPPAFLVGVAVNPNADDLDTEVERLRRKVDAGAHFAMSQVFFSWKQWQRFVDRCGGVVPIPTLIPVWPLRSLKLALRLHYEVPGIVVPQELLDKLEAAGADAAKVGRERAIELLREAPDHAAGAYIVAPFKQPEQVIPLLEDAFD